MDGSTSACLPTARTVWRGSVGIVVDRDRNLWWLLAAVTGGLPVARFVVWLLLHFVKQALPDVLLW